VEGIVLSKNSQLSCASYRVRCRTDSINADGVIVPTNTISLKLQQTLSDVCYYI